MHCTLFIPHLIPPPEMDSQLWRSVAAPALKVLLARAAQTDLGEADGSALLCDAFGLKQQYDWPLAPLIAHQEAIADQTGYWLCATPVHLEARRNGLVLADPATLNVTSEESTAFIAMLAEHLRGESITLQAVRADLWLLRCAAAQALVTVSLAGATGRDVHPNLPKGADGPRWHRILTEIQMLLHAHPANDAREARGLLPVNSVWLWGGGTMPQQAAPENAPFAAVWSDDTGARALSHFAGCRLEQSPASIDVSSLTGKSHFLSNDALSAPLNRGDAQAWCAAVTSLEQHWFNPLLAALKSRRLEGLTVLTTNGHSAFRFDIRPVDLLKFWRKNNHLQ